MCKLDQSKGLQIGETYHNNKAVLDFLSFIAESTGDEVVTEVKTSQFFSILLDGSTDIAGDEQESVFVRCSNKGDVKVKFLLTGTPKSTTSHDLFEFITQNLEEQNIDAVNPFPNKPWFLRICSTSVLKTLWEKEKLLVTSNFSLSRSIFYPF